jgi:hypothetical protein
LPYAFFSLLLSSFAFLCVLKRSFAFSLRSFAFFCLLSKCRIVKLIECDIGTVAVNKEVMVIIMGEKNIPFVPGYLFITLLHNIYHFIAGSMLDYLIDHPETVGIDMELPLWASQVPV